MLSRNSETVPKQLYHPDLFIFIQDPVLLFLHENISRLHSFFLITLSLEIKQNKKSQFIYRNLCVVSRMLVICLLGSQRSTPSFVVVKCPQPARTESKITLHQLFVCSPLIHWKLSDVLGPDTFQEFRPCC